MTRKPPRLSSDARTDPPRKTAAGVTVAREPAAEIQLSNAAASFADRLLVERCLAGEVAAWEELYLQCHEPMCMSIRAMIGSGLCDHNTVDEIAARVWYALVRNDGDLLSRFDPDLDLRLGTFLRGLARVEMMQHFRGERRRHAREAKASRTGIGDSHLNGWQVDAILDEFTATLTPGEQRFMDEYLLSLPSDDSETVGDKVSDANFWQRCHRIRTKLRTFFQGG